VEPDALLEEVAPRQPLERRAAGHVVDRRVERAAPHVPGADEPVELPERRIGPRRRLGLRRVISHGVMLLQWVPRDAERWLSTGLWWTSGTAGHTEHRPAGRFPGRGLARGGEVAPE